ncbi:hypothetical protein [Streptomyces sp. ODS28]|uniref:hypothetical protein n=1 Tax=Streptomyces sp. ODS28 TaxID=3136688 RepID=UPI0031E515A4
MPRTKTAKRSRTRRAGESAWGLLLLLKQLFMALVALLLIGTGVWSSWGTAMAAMNGEERGTLQVSKCGEDDCWGRFSPEPGKGEPREKIVISGTVSGKPGETLNVAVRKDEDGKTRAVRTGPAGILYAWVPLAGSLLLSALVVAGGLRMRRTAWGLGAVGALMMAGAWALLHFA